MGRRGLESTTFQEWMRHVGEASTDLHRAMFPHIPVKESAICCCGLAKASTTAYNELWLAGQALGKANHGAADGAHSQAAVIASQKVEAVMRRIAPMAEPNPGERLNEEGPKDQPDVETVQSNERRSMSPDDDPAKPKVEAP